MNLSSFFISEYQSVLIAVYVCVLIVFVQAVVASVAHRMQKSYVPGIVDESLGPESFVFRSYRTFVNSMENVPFMLALVFVAILSGFSADTLAIITWVYCVGRIAHMVTYYLVATRRNPSLRSHFYMVTVLAQLVLFVLLGMHFIS